MEAEKDTKDAAGLDQIGGGNSHTWWKILGFFASAIAGLFGYLMSQYSSEISSLKNDKAEMQVRLDSCLNRRFEEMVHRENERTEEIRQLKQENRERFDSLINNQMRILKKE